MIIREYFPELGQWTCRIWASDLARKVVERARPGIYSQIEINRGMPAKLLVKYFRRERLKWILNDEIRGMIEFFELNLARRWPSMVPMDLIFLRNALIYFDVETKRNILAQVRRVLRPDGYLLLGNSETTLGVDDGFERLADDRGGWHQLCGQEKAQ